MPGYPAPFIKFREDDANGFPLSGGKLYSYTAGTSTPRATYSDQGLAVPNANPTILDASGRANVWIQDGVGYKFVLTDSLGNTIWTQDNVQVPQIAATPAASNIPVGGIVAFGGTVAPSGWLLCDGSSVATATYPALSAVIGTTFGGGGASFNLPDLRQRFPLGKAAAGTGSTLGATGGLIQHTHTGPSHTHTINSHTHTLSAHTHTVPRDGWGSTLSTPGVTGRNQVGNSGGTGPDASQFMAANDVTTGVANPTDSSGTALTTNSGGTAATGPEDPPYLVLNYLIKT